MALDANKLADVYRRVTSWRANPEASVQCPACGAAGLTVIDRSARPYAEWYALSCPSCGLDETLHIPLGPSAQIAD
jgi:predicted RNA-binding Zn-ribbon protein involved in translation (DUF1610 family)